jgi:hypothetical protein
MLTYASGTLGLGLAQKFFSSPPESLMDVIPTSREYGQLFIICSRPIVSLNVTVVIIIISGIAISSSSSSAPSSSSCRRRPSPVQAEHLFFSLCYFNSTQF